MNTCTSERKPQFELLRIISMLSIVLLHFLSHGGVNEQLIQGSASFFIFPFFRSVAYLGVNCFVLISGYFLCEKEFKVSRIIKILLQTLFYSVLGAALAVIFLNKHLSMKEILLTVFPISGNKYWFVSVYVLMVIISPIINWALRMMNKEQHLTLVIGLVVSFSVIPTALFWGKSVFSDGKDIIWFLTLYVVAAYLKKYQIRSNHRRLLFSFFCLILLTAFIEVGIKLVANKIGIATPEKMLFYNNQPLVLGASIILFILVSNLQISHLANMICKIGRLTFGVYLLHDNDMIRAALWKMINAPRFLQSPLLEIGYMLLVVLSIFAVGCLVERFRMVIFTRLELRIGRFTDERCERLLLYLLKRTNAF